MTPLSTGRYTITNVRFRNVALLLDPYHGSSIVCRPQVEGSPNESWDVVLLSNKNYTIKNCEHGSYATCLPSPGVQDDILGATDNTHQWRIREIKNMGQYAIYPSDAMVCWSLSDGENETPMTFATAHNDPKCQWIFTKVSDEDNTRINLHTLPALLQTVSLNSLDVPVYVDRRASPSPRIETHDSTHGSPQTTTESASGDITVIIETIRGTSSIRELIRHLSYDNFQVQQEAADALATITIVTSMSEPTSNAFIALQWNAIPALVHLINSTNVGAHEGASHALANINRVKEASAVSVEANAIPSLINLLTSGDPVVRPACRALHNICLASDHARAVAFGAGALPLLLPIISEEVAQVQVAAMLLLCTICTHKPAAIAAVSQNAIPALVGLLYSDNVRTQEYAARALKVINNVPEARPVSLEANAIPALVNLLASNDDTVLLPACHALGNILTSDRPRLVAFSAGALRSLVPLLYHSNINVQFAALQPLQSISHHTPAAVAATNTNVMPALVRLGSSKILNVKRQARNTMTNINRAKYAAAAGPGPSTPSVVDPPVFSDPNDPQAAKPKKGLASRLPKALRLFSSSPKTVVPKKPYTYYDSSDDLISSDSD